MDKNRVTVILSSILLIILLVITFILGRKSVDIPEVKTETKWDTVHIEKPVPYKVGTTKTEYRYLPRIINIPIFISEPKVDTTYNKTTEVDSVQVSVQIERKIYQDERYKAVISGPRIGDLSPTLDTLDIYTKTETKIIEKPYPFLVPYISFGGGKNIIGIGGGVTIKQRIDIGAKYLRIQDQNMFMIESNIRFNK